MIFTPENAAKVLDGSKTQTRRPTRLGDDAHVLMNRIAAVKRNGRYLWRVNDGTLDWIGMAGIGGNDGSRGGGSAAFRQPTYSVQPGRGKRGLDRIRILEIRTEPLMAISEKDALAEGFASTDEFFDEWRALYGSLDPNKMVWVLTFRLVPEEWLPRWTNIRRSRSL